MTVDLATLALKVDALEVDAAAKKLDNLTAAGGRTEKSAGGLSTAFRATGLALGAIGIAQAARQAVGLADSYANAEGRLNLITNSIAELEAAQLSLYGISQRSRAEYLSTADVYTRFAQATKGQGIAQAELLSITETLNKAFVISGASTQEASNAMLQLSQGFSSGVLRGDEFNSVMESGGRVVDMLADHLLVSRGELRAMAESGRLTSDVLRGAIVSGATQVNAEFGKMPTTVGQAGAVLRNTLGSLVSDANKASGATEGIASAILGLSSTIDEHKGGILSFFSSMASAGAQTFSGFEMGAEAAGESVAKLESRIVKNNFALKNGISEMQAEIDRIYAHPGLAAIKTESGELAIMNHQLEAQKKILADLQTSPYITGAAGAKMDIVAEATKGIAFAMAGVRAQSESSMRVTDDMRKKTLSYIETAEQALMREKNAAMSGTKSAEERALVEKRYVDEIGKLHERNGKAGTEAAKIAKASARDYQSILDHLEPLRVAQEEYNNGLAALNQMDPTHQTERYGNALGNLGEQYRQAAEAADILARKEREMREALEAQAESELSRKMVDIDISISKGGLSHIDALPQRIVLLQDNLSRLQEKLSELGKGKSQPEGLIAWNSQLDKVKQATVDLVEYQEQFRLQNPWEAARQGLRDYANTATVASDTISSAMTSAMSTMTDVLAGFVTTGKLEFSDLCNSILDDLAKIAIQQNITGPLAGGLSAALGGWLSSGVSLGAFNDVSALTSGNLFAHGEVFASHGLSAYSNSIVSSPTVFPFASGVGLMGEAGPEAIMPLTRTRGGDLGVRIEGGGNTQIVNVIEAPGKGGTQTQRTENGANVIDVFVDRIKNAVASDISSGSGVVPNALQSTYGLNRSFGGN